MNEFSQTCNKQLDSFKYVNLAYKITKIPLKSWQLQAFLTGFQQLFKSLGYGSHFRSFMRVSRDPCYFQCHVCLMNSLLCHEFFAARLLFSINQNQKPKNLLIFHRKIWLDIWWYFSMLSYNMRLHLRCMQDYVEDRSTWKKRRMQDIPGKTQSLGLLNSVFFLLFSQQSLWWKSCNWGWLAFLQEHFILFWKHSQQYFEVMQKAAVNVLFLF